MPIRFKVILATNLDGAVIVINYQNLDREQDLAYHLDGDWCIGDIKDFKLEIGQIYKAILIVIYWEDHHPQGPIEYNSRIELEDCILQRL